MQSKTFFVGWLAITALFFSSQALAQELDPMIVVDVDSSSETITVRSDLCLGAVKELIVEQGFQLNSVSPVGVKVGPSLTGFVFTRLLGDNEVVVLLCISNVNINAELGGPGGGPGDPGGPGRPR